MDAKHYLTFFVVLSLLCMNPIQLASQSPQDDVTLVVSGTGADKVEATKIALRSAIEQAYGVFVSASMDLLNDEVVRDEIVTVASGNIKSYSEISSFDLHDGSVSVTLSTVVSTGKLIAYAQAKGASVEFAGQAFLMNQKMYEMNKHNEISALYDLIKEAKELAPVLFDSSLSIGDAKKIKAFYNKANEEGTEATGYKIPMVVEVRTNDNYDIWIEHFIDILSRISLSGSNLDEAKRSNQEISILSVEFNNTQRIFYMRSELSLITSNVSDLVETLNYATKQWELTEKGTARTYVPSIDFYYDEGKRQRTFSLINDRSTVCRIAKDITPEEGFMYNGHIRYADYVGYSIAQVRIDGFFTKYDMFYIFKQDNIEFDSWNLFFARLSRNGVRLSFGNKKVFPVEIFYKDDEIQEVSGFELGWRSSQ